MSSTPVTPSAVSNTADNKPSTSVKMPENISFDKWVDSGFEWSGEVMPRSFERVAPLLTTEHTQSALLLNTQIYRHNNVQHLAIKLTGEVWLQCQRCLQPVAIDLTDDYNLALLEDDSQISLIDEEQDYLLLDEVMTELSPERLLPLKKLVEDELLLKIPLAAKHDDCEMAITQVGELPEEQEVENPFAALVALKGKL